MARDVDDLLAELDDILNMDWIWLARKPLYALLKWRDDLHIVLRGHSHSSASRTNQE